MCLQLHVSPVYQEKWVMVIEYPSYFLPKQFWSFCTQPFVLFQPKGFINWFDNTNMLVNFYKKLILYKEEPSKHAKLAVHWV